MSPVDPLHNFKIDEHLKGSQGQINSYHEVFILVQMIIFIVPDSHIPAGLEPKLSFSKLFLKNACTVSQVLTTLWLLSDGVHNPS